MKGLPSDIQKLDERIKRFKKRKSTENHKSGSQMRLFLNYAFRMATEFVSPIVIGLCLGFMLDSYFNTKPFAMLILAIFGCAAGVLNMYRASQDIDKEMPKDK